MKDEEKEESHLWGFFKGGAELFALFFVPFALVNNRFTGNNIHSAV